jgi:uncharacterized membrane protein
MKKKDLLILIIPLLIVAVLYPFLPAQIPRQFHLGGRPTSYMAKEFIFLVGLLPFVIYKFYQAKRN